MTEWWIKIASGYFKMCLIAVAVIGVVFVLRLMLKNVSKNIVCLLWIAVLFRLLCPVALEGPFPNLWGGTQSVDRNPQSSAGLAEGDGAGGEYIPGVSSQDAVDSVVSPEDNLWMNGASSSLWEELGQTGETLQTMPDEAAQPEKVGQTGTAALPETADTVELEKKGLTSMAAWLGRFGSGQNDRFAKRVTAVCGLISFLGTIVFAVMGGKRYLRTAKMLKNAVTTGSHKYEAVSVPECAGIVSPMVFGVLKPRIYLPVGFAAGTGERELELILEHEKAHIRRGDFLWKILSWVALSLHWWNPLVWICVKMFQKDMEMACDEYVMLRVGEESRREYASALLHFSMKQNGLVFPAAFGESNTEQRVKNILKYRKKPVILTVLALGAVGVAVLCLVTNPRDTVLESDNDVVNQTETAQDDLQDTLTFDSLEELQVYYLDYWQQKLTAQAAENETLRISVQFLDKDKSEEDLHTISDRSTRMELRYYVADTSRAGIPTVYKTWVECSEQDGKFYVFGAENEAFEKVTTAKQAQRMGVFPFAWRSGETEESNYAGDVEFQAMLSSSSWPFDLKEPVSALERLLHLEGGTGEVQPAPGYGANRVYVTYTFADGSSIVYLMGNDISVHLGSMLHEHWFPVWFSDAEQVEIAKKTEEYITQVSAEELKTAQIVYDEESGHWADGYSTFSGKFVLLDEAEDRDLALYGLCGGEAMVLRDGEQCYPVNLSWMSVQMNLPRIYAGDFDGDGQEEYGLWTHMKTGTGVSGSELYILEHTGEDALLIREFDYYTEMEQLDRVTYNWSEEYQALEIKVDGQHTGTTLFLNKWMEEMAGLGPFEGLALGDITDFICRDGQWYYWALGGIVLRETGVGLVHYERGMELLAPVIYTPEGKFSLGEIRVKAVTGETDAVDETYEKFKQEGRRERLVNAAYADVTHDGKDDVILTTVTYWPEQTKSTLEELLAGGEMLYIRVYDGDSMEWYLEKQGAKAPQVIYETEGYLDLYCLWEKELATVHAGNGSVFLAQRDGQDYLIDCYAWVGHGAAEFAYQVFSLDIEGRIYEEDYQATGCDTNESRFTADPDENFDIEEMLSYTESLDTWLRDAEAVAFLDVYMDPIVSTGEKTYTMRGWEVWNVLFTERPDNMKDLEKKLNGLYTETLEMYGMTGR